MSNGACASGGAAVDTSLAAFWFEYSGCVASSELAVQTSIFQVYKYSLGERVWGFSGFAQQAEQRLKAG